MAEALESVGPYLLMLGDFDLAEGDGHVFSTVELEAEGAFFDGGFGFVGDAFDAIEPSFVGVSFDLNFENVPVLGFDGGDGFLALGGVTLAGDVGSGGEITLEGPGDADLDLVVGLLDHDPGVDGAFAKLVFESEGEILEFLLGPKKGAGFFGAGLTLDEAFLHGPMGVLALGVDAPVFEVFAVEEGLVSESGEGEKEEDEEFHGLIIRDLGSGLSFANHSDDEAGSEEGDHEPGDHLGGDDFIQKKPAPEDAKERDEKGHRSGHGGSGALDQFEEENEGQSSADQGERGGAEPTGKGRGFFW